MKLRLQAASAAFVYVLTFCPGFGATLTAPAVVHDYGAWIPVSVKVPIWRKWQGFLEVQPRFYNGHPGKISENQVRTGIGYQFNPRWSAFAGYFWSPHFDDPVNMENRIWQQVGYSRKFENVTIQNRFRCEQTWRDQYQGASVRIRNQIRVTRDLGSSPYYVALSEEPFYNLNNPKKGPQEGFVQNRLFIGVGKRLNSFTRLEIGYMNQYKNSRSKSPDDMNHLLVASLALDFTALKRKKQYKMAQAAPPASDTTAHVACVPQLLMGDFFSPAQMIFADSHSADPAYHPALAGLAHAKRKVL